jgi:hypothetical protein
MHTKGNVRDFVVVLECIVVVDGLVGLGMYRGDRRNDRGTPKWATTFSELIQHNLSLHRYENE